MQNSKFSKLVTIYRSDSNILWKIFKRWKVQLRNNHPLLIGFRDSNTNENGRERWLLLLNATITSMAASAFVYGSQTNTTQEEILLLIFSCAFATIQPKLMGYILTHSKPETFDLKKALQDADARFDMRGYIRCYPHNQCFSTSPQREKDTFRLRTLKFTLENERRHVLQRATDYFVGLGALENNALSKSQVKVFVKWFHKCVELGQILEGDALQYEVGKMIRQLDSVNEFEDGLIDYREFQIWFWRQYLVYGRFWEGYDKNKFLQRGISLFDSFDKDGSGHLVGQEIDRLFENFHSMLFPQDFRKYDNDELRNVTARRFFHFLTSLDKNKDYEIQASEFIDWFGRKVNRLQNEDHDDQYSEDSISIHGLGRFSYLKQLLGQDLEDRAMARFLRITVDNVLSGISESDDGMYVCNITVNNDTKVGALGQHCKFEIDIHDQVVISISYRQFKNRYEIGKCTISILELLSEGADMSLVQVDLPLESDQSIICSFRAEIMSTMHKPFADVLYNAIDKDNDMHICMHEMKVFCEKAHFLDWERLFMILDRNNQEEISKEEFYHCMEDPMIFRDLKRDVFRIIHALLEGDPFKFHLHERWRVVRPFGISVSVGYNPFSPKVGRVPWGQEVEIVERVGSRVRIVHPINGWISSHDRTYAKAYLEILTQDMKSETPDDTDFVSDDPDKYEVPRHVPQIVFSKYVAFHALSKQLPLFGTVLV